MYLKPKVSVVTITYGHEKYIVETLDGVLMQTYDGPVEFIIANDDSPDNTDGVIRRYFEEHNPPSNFTINYVRHEKNKGMNLNFLWALKQASGNYIALCEGDDYWNDPLKLQKQVDFMEQNHGYSACQHNRVLLDRFGNLTFKPFKKSIYTQCVLFRNILCGDYYNKAKHIFNGDTFLEYYLKTKGSFGYLDFIGAVYRYNGKGVYSSQNDSDRVTTSIASYHEILSALPLLKKTHKTELQKIIIELQYILAYNEKGQRQKKHFKEYCRLLFSFKNFSVIDCKRIIKYFLTHNFL